MKLFLKDKGLVSERHLRQAIYFMEYSRRDPNMSHVLFCIQMHLIALWCKYAFIKKVPFDKKWFLEKFGPEEFPSLNGQQLNESLMKLDQIGYIKYYPAEGPDESDRFTMILLLKVRAYPQIVWKGNTFRGIKSLKKHMQLSLPLAIDNQGLKIADSVTSSPFAPSLKQIKDLFKEYKYPLNEAVEFYRHHQYNDWIQVGKTIRNWKRSAHQWMKKAQRRSATDQLKT